MKMTVITGKDGKLVAAAYGHHPPADHKQGHAPEVGHRAGLRAAPGQKLHLLEVSDEIMGIAAAAEFHSAIESELRKALKK